VTDKVRLLFGVHAHQPVGNFTHVIDDALRRCYRPFLEAVERHPGIRMSLHVSGWLLDYLHRTFPHDVERIRRMAARGQLELIGGGDTEPVLAAIPERDRRDQLRAMNDRVEKLFGVRPRGAWLTERVWEATVVPSLHASGLRFVAVDDYHFRSVGVAGDLNGYYTTEESGHRLDVFPISEALRYLMPFAPAAEVVKTIEAFPPGAAAIYFDDIEKFGVWPDTYEWVYDRGWLEAVLSGLESSPRVEMQTFGEFHEQRASCGLVYLPTTSYAEMNEWTLPPSGARRLQSLLRRSADRGTLQDDEPMLRGGTWKGFLMKYPEANWMHKRVQQASHRLHALPAEQQTPELIATLHRTQANDAYWHGLFGGIYLPFLRRSVYANLAALESTLDEIEPRPASHVFDVDLDGAAEIALRAGRFHAVIKPAEGGRLCELTDHGFKHNFADVLARRDEEYYDIIRAGVPPPPLRPRKTGIASIHERVIIPADITPEDLEPDRAPRGLFVDAWNEATIQYMCEAVAGGPQAACRAQLDGLSIEKSFRIDGDVFSVQYALAAGRAVTGSLSVEVSIAMPSGDGPGGAYILDGVSQGTFAARISRAGAPEVALQDAELGGRLDLAMSPPCALATQPLVTVSRSESGFEKIMQGTVITCAWVIALDAGARAERTITLRCATTRS
jgi:hypothetical protein